MIGYSSLSCNNNALPYLPQKEDIEYSLGQVNEALSLNVTIVVRHSQCAYNCKINIIPY